MFLPWFEIANFHNVRRLVTQYPHLLNGDSRRKYRGKIKLHGTCSGVEVTHDSVTPMSRSQFLSPDEGIDNAGFGKWVIEHFHHFIDIDVAPDSTLVIYGEWCGKGIQSGVAASQLSGKIWAVFGAKLIYGDVIEFINEPQRLSEIVSGIPDTYVLPWMENSEIIIDWASSADELERAIQPINDLVSHVEACDPWILENFGIRGVGEGVVYYPVGNNVEDFKNLAFKAKGEKHKVVATKNAVVVSATVAKSCEDFAKLVLAPARLQQGIDAIGATTFEMSKIGNFLKWCHQDVEKECGAEFDATQIDKKLLEKACSAYARTWYIEQSKKV